MAFLSITLGFVSSSYANQDGVSLYVITHLSRMAAFRIAELSIEVPYSVMVESMSDPALQLKLQSFQDFEDRRKDLGGLSVVKTWGLASLSGSDVVAACASIHAGDTPEYPLRSQEHCTIVFASDSCQEIFPWQEEVTANDANPVQNKVIEAVFAYKQMKGLAQSAFSDRIFKATAAARSILHKDDDTTEQDTFVEECQICGQSIPFESPVEASCANGHQYSKFPTRFGHLALRSKTSNCCIQSSMRLDFYSDHSAIHFQALRAVRPHFP